MAGFYEGSDLANKTLYGFRLNSATGHLCIEVIKGGIDPVVLPQDGFIDANDYKQWVWSEDTLQFEINDNGHLLMRVL